MGWLGALYYKSVDQSQFFKILGDVKRAIQEHYPGVIRPHGPYWPFSAFNDHPDTTIEDVRLVLRLSEPITQLIQGAPDGLLGRMGVADRHPGIPVPRRSRSSLRAIFRSDTEFRSPESTLYYLRLMRWDESRLLMVTGVVTAVVGVGIILVGIGRHAGYNVAAALLTLLSALFGYRAWDLSTHRRLEEIQRAQLLARLRQLPAAEVRIAAVPSEEAVRFARDLLDVFIEAGWPAQGVYRAVQGNASDSGLVLAVKDRDYPPDEANLLLLALSEFGLQTTKSSKASLVHAGALDLLVGRGETQSQHVRPR
jgi:hypothetical protein